MKRCDAARTLMMGVWLYLAYTVLVADLALTRGARSLDSELQLLTADLKGQLAEATAREARIWSASAELHAAHEQRVCGAKMATLRKTSVVYTWVNGSESEYRKMRQKHGGKTSVGGARDRSIDELRFSIRSLVKHIPWLEGNIYVVAPPGQRPSWLSAEQERVIIVDQESLFRPQDSWALPTFNTNAIEPHLWCRRRSRSPHIASALCRRLH